MHKGVIEGGRQNQAFICIYTSTLDWRLLRSDGLKVICERADQEASMQWFVDANEGMGQTAEASGQHLATRTMRDQWEFAEHQVRKVRPSSPTKGSLLINARPELVCCATR